MKSCFWILGCVLLVGCKQEQKTPASSDAVARVGRPEEAKISEHAAVDIAAKHAQAQEPNLLDAFLVRAELTPLGWDVTFSPRRQHVVGGEIRVLVDKQTGAVIKMSISQ
jgi:hypothetical protein